MSGQINIRGRIPLTTGFDKAALIEAFRSQGVETNMLRGQYLLFVRDKDDVTTLLIVDLPNAGWSEVDGLRAALALPGVLAMIATPGTLEVEDEETGDPNAHFFPIPYGQSERDRTVVEAKYYLDKAGAFSNNTLLIEALAVAHSHLNAYQAETDRLEKGARERATPKPQKPKGPGPGFDV